MVLPAHALQRAKLNSSQRSSRRAVMSGEQEDDLVDKACVYLLESRYPDGCSGNTKRIIQRKAAMLTTRGGEVFYKKARKDSAGKKVLQQLYCYKQQYTIFTTQVVQEVRYIRSSEERMHMYLYIPVHIL